MNNVSKFWYHCQIIFSQGNARVGDDFMKQLEPIAAYVPYLTCPGNHEEK